MTKHSTFPSPLALLIGVVSIAFLFTLAHPSPSKLMAMPTPIPSPPPLPTGTPQSLPITGIVGATNVTGGQSITEDDIRAFVMNHNMPGNMGSKTFRITKVTELTAVQVALVLHGAATGQPDNAMLWYVELAGNFRFAGSAQQPDGLSYTTGFEVFIASNGNLLMEGGLVNPTSGVTPIPQPTNTPAGVPTATPVASGITPTAVPPTATPVAPPHLTATMPTEKCANANWLNPIVLMNTGGQLLNWNGSVPAGYTLTPSSGSLPPGASVSVTIGPQFTTPWSGSTFPVNVTSNGGNLALNLVCNG